MDYTLYEIEDFVADESYLRYYFKLNNTDIVFWKNWISTHPEKLDVVMNADQLIGFLFLQLPEEEFQKECERMLKAIKPSTAETEQSFVNATSPDYMDVKPSGFSTFFKQYRSVWTIAASVMFIITISSIYFLKGAKNNNGTAMEIFGKDKVEVNENNTNRSLIVQLEDGTAVKLQPGATLTWPAHFLNDKREVYLEGEAFFEVSKNAKRPFYVYNNNLVTHVLGTSFNVKIDKQKKEVEVSVRTGRVEVSERVTISAASNAPVKSNGVVLTPNQRVIYKEETQSFEATLVDTPLPVAPETTKPNVAVSGNRNSMGLFTEARMSEILKYLENTYGIAIEVESENINNCHFSGDISDINLFSKLDFLCKAIGASYEIKGTKIIIRGKGCD